MPARLFPVVLALSLASACTEVKTIADRDPSELDAVQRARMRLGHDLFFDPGLSGAGDVSCASCHDPERAGTDGRAKAVGTGGRMGRRNAPSTFNAALKDLQFWDGRAETLEEQAAGPLFADDEMGQTEAGLLDYVGVAYAEPLADAFPDEDGPTVAQVTVALATYQRMLPRRSRFDRFLDGDRGALSNTERRGWRLFDRNCAFCHDGPGVGGTHFEKLGDAVAWPEDRREDQGRFEITGDPDDRMVFVVPSLRNAAQTGPWFHDGSVETLERAVRLMARHQLGRTLSDRKVKAIVAFLETLDAEEPAPWASADWPN